MGMSARPLASTSIRPPDVLTLTGKVRASRPRPSSRTKWGSCVPVTQAMSPFASFCARMTVSVAGEGLGVERLLEVFDLPARLALGVQLHRPAAVEQHYQGEAEQPGGARQPRKINFRLVRAPPGGPGVAALLPGVLIHAERPG